MTRFLVFLLAFSLCLRADAQALPAFSGLVNKAIGSTVQKTAVRRGFAVNDPRMLTTFTGMAGTVAIVAADVAIAAATAATAPVWMTVAAAVGAVAIVGGISFGVYKVFFDEPDSSAKFVVKGPAVSYSGPVGEQPSGPYTHVEPGSLVFDQAQHVVNSTNPRIPNGALNFGGITVFGDDPNVMMQTAASAWVAIGGGMGATFQGCDPETPIDAYGVSTVTCHALRIGSGGNVQPQSEWPHVENTFQMYSNPVLAPATFKGTVGEIVPSLSSAELAKPASTSAVSALANALWQAAAAKPGYAGIPYSVTDPVTDADAEAAKVADPAAWPRNADLVSPVAPAAGQPVVINPLSVTDPSPTPTDPSSVPGGASNVNVVNTPTVNVANQVKVDWGADPRVMSPSLEATPSALSILSPLFDLMPTLRNFVVPNHSSVCPKPNLSLFNQTLTMDSHCTVLDGIKPTLFAVMAFVWLLAGTLIVLRA
ncbi:hypothetical protein ACFDR9_002814 [Janthinobacterium sp. CG_23.3]|uniref:hypothetical protein n=1 Tax=Janthinobacterium sp. CG_23.3 TaxID=3349634 RepID=UPI0038D4FB07